MVLLVFDELPQAGLLDSDGEIDARRFPNFAALQRQSDWFRNTVTVADSTEQAVPAILSSELPDPDGVATYTDHPKNLFTLLGSSYQTNISESGAHLCPPEMCPTQLLAHRPVGPRARRRALDRGGGVLPLRAGGDGGSRAGPRVCARQRAEQAGGALPRRDQRRRQGGSLNAIHLELPHIPWRYTPSGPTYFTGTYPLGLTIERWSRSPGYPIQGLQRMTLQLEYADRILGVIVQSLRNWGIYDKAVMAVVADHGAAFIPGQSRRLLSTANSGWILRVPMFVKLPHQRRGRIISRPVRTIDLLPTIADVLGIRIPWQVDGRSLFERRHERV